MGIHGLTTLIADNAASAISEMKIENLFNRRIAIDVSMSIYQFVIGIRGTGADLTSDSGDITSHLQGLLARTVRLIENGVKPVFVFDGAPPELKRAELEKRKALAEENKAKQDGAEAGTEDAIKYSKRTVRVTKEQNEEARRLLQLLGVPVIQAPSEAEAQCAALCKAGVVWAAGSEDMDTLTFGSPLLVRNLTFSQAQMAKKGVMVIDLAKALKELDLTHEQFVDMCILCGCDYAGTIKGIGPVTALRLVRQHKRLEEILPTLDSSKYPLPDPFPYVEIREFFMNPPSIDVEEARAQMKWTEVDEEGLVQFLCGEKGFQEERVRKTCQKLRATKTSGVGTQNRIDQFFKVQSSDAKKDDGKKRPADKAAKGKDAKKAKK
jgi:flap endonuclease-1